VPSERRRAARNHRIGARRLASAALAVVLVCSAPWLPGGPSKAQAGHAGTVNILDVDYVRAQYDKGRKLTAIDLRSAEEFRRGHLPGARSLPIGELTTRFAEVPRTDLVILYCDCPRSEVEVAYWFLRQRQYRNLTVLDQGFSAWVQGGHPVERPSAQ
jgi:rhodanese-related sulfurtransferase